MTVKHTHDVDCMDYYPSGIGGWLLICEVTHEIFYIAPGSNEVIQID